MRSTPRGNYLARLRDLSEEVREDWAHLSERCLTHLVRQPQELAQAAEETRLLVGVFVSSYEVFNGGLTQFLCNSVGALWIETEAGYEALGLTEAANVLRASRSALGLPPKDFGSQPKRIQADLRLTELRGTGVGLDEEDIELGHTLEAAGAGGFYDLQALVGMRCVDLGLAKDEWIPR